MVRAEIQRCERAVLHERGIDLEPGTTFVEKVSLTLRIPMRQGKTFLDAIYNGATVEQAASAAGLEFAELQNDALIDAAIAIGYTLSRSRASV